MCSSDLFAVEFLRADDRGEWLGGSLTTSQIISLPLAAWAVWVLVRGRSWPFPPAPAESNLPPAPAQGTV